MLLRKEQSKTVGPGSLSKRIPPGKGKRTFKGTGCEETSFGGNCPERLGKAEDLVGESLLRFRCGLALKSLEGQSLKNVLANRSSGSQTGIVKDNGAVLIVADQNRLVANLLLQAGKIGSPVLAREAKHCADHLQGVALWPGRLDSLIGGLNARLSMLLPGGDRDAGREEMMMKQPTKHADKTQRNSELQKTTHSALLMLRGTETRKGERYAECRIVEMPESHHCRLEGS